MSESTVTRLRFRRPGNRSSVLCGSLDSSLTTASKSALKSTQLSRYSDWLRAGRPRDRSSSPGRVNNFLSRPAVRSTNLLSQGTRGSGGK
jgi:hypothetical protein